MTLDASGLLAASGLDGDECCGFCAGRCPVLPTDVDCGALVKDASNVDVLLALAPYHKRVRDGRDGGADLDVGDWAPHTGLDCDGEA